MRTRGACARLQPEQPGPRCRKSAKPLLAPNKRLQAPRSCAQKIDPSCQICQNQICPFKKSGSRLSH